MKPLAVGDEVLVLYGNSWYQKTITAVDNEAGTFAVLMGQETWHYLITGSHWRLPGSDYAPCSTAGKEVAKAQEVLAQLRHLVTTDHESKEHFIQRCKAILDGV